LLGRTSEVLVCDVAWKCILPSERNLYIYAFYLFTQGCW